MAVTILMKVLEWINDKVIEEYLTTTSNNNKILQQRQFEPKKSLQEQDEMIITMLNSVGHEDVSYCICDPSLDDCPIIFASDGFCNFTGYTSNEIEGKNCRFLQGLNTKKEDIDKIRLAIKEEKEESVNLLNYRKDGTSFNNEFFMKPMYSDEDKKKLQYFIGIQCSVERLGPGQCPKNVGWIYTSGLHA